MKATMKIEYHWSCDKGIEIPEKHLEALKEDAEERIFAMIGQGYRSGDLNTTVRFGKDVVPEEDEEEGLYYKGCWKISHT